MPGTRQQDVSANGKSAGALRCKQFDGDVALVMKHRYVQIMGLRCMVGQQDIGTHGASHAKPGLVQRVRSRDRAVDIVWPKEGSF